MTEFTIEIGSKKFEAKEPSFSEIQVIKEKTGLDLLKGGTAQSESITLDNADSICLLMAYILKPVGLPAMSVEEKVKHFMEHGTTTIFSEVILSFFAFFKQRMNESKARFQVLPANKNAAKSK